MKQAILILIRYHLPMVGPRSLHWQQLRYHFHNGEQLTANTSH